MTASPDPGTHQAGPESLGLTAQIRACLFDLDGVLTETAKIHAAAWKDTFDGFLRTYCAQHGKPFQAFDEVKDYEVYVDGKPRADGIRSFLKSRDITLPDGQDGDPPTAETVQGLGNAKNTAFTEILDKKGVDAFEGSVRYVKAVREANLRCAVVTSSANCHAVLKAAGLDGYFDATVDGSDLKPLGLRGKPAPDTFLAAARKLGVEPAEAAVYEDALAGVEAGRAGRFGRVIGVDRLGQADALREHGADVVVTDLGDLLSTNR